MLTIGEVARLAGTTVRAVRHYTATGLVPEPERDASGYRRYRSTDLVLVVRVRRLRELGIPLSQVAALLDAPPEAVALALGALDAELTASIVELQERRDRLRALRDSGLDAELPAGLSDLPRRLLAAGVPAASVAVEKDALLLGLTVLDGAFPGSISDFYGSLLGDEARWASTAALSARMDELPDDADAAEVDALARGFLELLELPDAPEAATTGAAHDRVVAQLLEDFTATLAPGQRRVLERVVELTEEAQGSATT
jgi:DNA-binding transcriptional MerR regulator